MSSDLDPAAFVELLARAEEASALSYSPYSKYRVGAAVETDAGIFVGANVENASYNLGLCAERAALTAALMNGAKVVYRVAVCCFDARKDEAGKVIDPYETMPCGGCRQWLAELAPNAVVMTNGIEKPLTVNDLLPNAFKLGS
ncbi:MAG: cytidine deaminase [Verrucomicrobiota bacterium]